MDKTEIFELATDVAKYLGENWSVDSSWDSNGRMLVCTDGRKLHIYAPGQYAQRSLVGRIVVNTTYPYRDGAYTDPNNHIEITVKADRGAEVIAKEIQRRVLPEYTERFVKVLGENHMHRVTVAAVVEAEAKVCAAMGKPRPQHTERDRVERDARTSVSLASLITGYGSVEVYGHTPSDVRAKIELASVDFDTALAIIELLGERGAFKH